MSALVDMDCCPFCGGEEASVFMGEPGPGIVICWTPGCGAQMTGFKTNEEAIAAWNRRPAKRSLLDADVEDAAKWIFDLLPHDGPICTLRPVWVAGGTSPLQEYARWVARALIAAGVELGATPAPEADVVAKPSADLRGLVRAAANIIQDERDCIAAGHTVNGELQFDDDDFLAKAAIEDMDNWLISAKSALYPLDVTGGSKP